MVPSNFLIDVGLMPSEPSNRWSKFVLLKVIGRNEANFSFFFDKNKKTFDMYRYTIILCTKESCNTKVLIDSANILQIAHHSVVSRR